MAGVERMTIEEVVRKVLRADHGDVIRASVRGGLHCRSLVRRDEVLARR